MWYFKIEGLKCSSGFGLREVWAVAACAGLSGGSPSPGQAAAGLLCSPVPSVVLYRGLGSSSSVCWTQVPTLSHGTARALVAPPSLQGCGTGHVYRPAGEPCAAAGTRDLV